MNKSEKRLLQIFSRLPEPQQQNLLAFADFLAAGARETAPGLVVPEPSLIPRPEQETVIAAIKRLTASYPMLDRPDLLNETSMLMTRHVMQGEAATEVIDELEKLFKRFYQQLLNDNQAR